MKEKLEKIVDKTKKSFGKALAIAALGSSLGGNYIDSARADVEFSMEAKNSIGFPKRFWKPDYSILALLIYADNTSETTTTKGLEWKVIPPKDLQLFFAEQPNPHYHYSDRFSGETNDFFYPYTMNSQSNTVSLDKNIRRITGIYGPTQAKGLVGIYYFNVLTNSSMGNKEFKIVDTKAYDNNGTEQHSTGSSLTINVMQDLKTLDKTPKLILDFNKKPEVFVSHFSKQLVLDTSSDGRNWEPVSTNDWYFNDDVFKTWMPFNYRDKSATNANMRLYRARTIE